MKALITRTKLYPTPGANYRVAWKHYYDVLGVHDAKGLPVVLEGFDRLDAAKDAAKRYGATEITLNWEYGR